MINGTKRVSQKDLAEVVANAVTIEVQRIEQLNESMLDQVNGGTGDTPPPTGTTVGMVPTGDPQPVIITG